MMVTKWLKPYSPSSVSVPQREILGDKKCKLLSLRLLQSTPYGNSHQDYLRAEKATQNGIMKMNDRISRKKPTGLVAKSTYILNYSDLKTVEIPNIISRFLHSKWFVVWKTRGTKTSLLKLIHQLQSLEYCAPVYKDNPIVSKYFWFKIGLGPTDFAGPNRAEIQEFEFWLVVLLSWQRV